MQRPREIILIALKNHIEAQVALLPNDELYSVRHHRHRNTADDEFNCLSLRWQNDDMPGMTNGGDSLSSSEEVVFMAVDFIAEVKLASEGSGADPTGLGGAGKILAHALSTLFTDGEQAETLNGLLWDIRYDGSSDEDDVSTEEVGRLSERVTLLYRVRKENPNSILT